MYTTLFFVCACAVLSVADVTMSPSDESPDKRLLREMGDAFWRHRDAMLDLVLTEVTESEADVILDHVTSELMTVDEIVTQRISCAQCTVRTVQYMYLTSRTYMCILYKSPV